MPFVVVGVLIIGSILLLWLASKLWIRAAFAEINGWMPDHMKVADRRALPAAAIGYFLLGLWIGVGLYVVGVRPWQFAVLPVVLASLLRVGSIPVAHRLRFPDQKPSRGWTDASRFQATAALLEAVVAGVLILDV